MPERPAQIKPRSPHGSWPAEVKVPPRQLDPDRAAPSWPPL